VDLICSVCAETSNVSAHFSQQPLHIPDTYFFEIVLEALNYYYPSTKKVELQVAALKSHHALDKTELRSEAISMSSKPGYGRFETSSSMTFSVSVNLNMMVNSLKSINNDNNNYAEFTFVTGMKIK